MAAGRDMREGRYILQTPDITQAQVASVVTFAAGQAVAWGVINDHTGQIVVSVASTVLAATWKLADAWIRSHRAPLAVAHPLAEAAHALAASPAPVAVVQPVPAAVPVVAAPVPVVPAPGPQ